MLDNKPVGVCCSATEDSHKSGQSFLGIDPYGGTSTVEFDAKIMAVLRATVNPERFRVLVCRLNPKTIRASLRYATN
jgi:hypothetical protein